jgi:hypothetical protein
VTPDDSSFSWTCSACGRQVPRRVARCRCGAVASTDQAPIDDPRSGSRRALAALLAVVCVLGVAGFVWTGRGSHLPQQGVRPPGDRPAPTAARGNTDAAGAVAPGTWPSNVPFVHGEAGAANGVPAPAPLPATSLQVRGLEELIAAALPAVVLVETPAGRGTGFFISPQVAVTNAHVVQSAGYVTLIWATGERATARVTQTASDEDLAILQVSAPRPGQALLPLGQLKDVRVGQEVVAIGAPLGLQNTVTRGIISAVRRSGSVMLVQTDAAINPGNSGGPLVDRTGRIVGVTTMKMAGAAESLGFAVAADHVRALISGGTPVVSAGSAGSLPDVLGAGEGTTDDLREEGATTLERALADIARRADALDDRWARLNSSCPARPLRQSGDREWFAVWNAAFSGDAAWPGCADAVDDFRRSAATIRVRTLEADEEARRAGVFPGTRRELRTQYRLNWDADRP